MQYSSDFAKLSSSAQSVSATVRTLQSPNHGLCDLFVIGLGFSFVERNSSPHSVPLTSTNGTFYFSTDWLRTNLGSPFYIFDQFICLTTLQDTYILFWIQFPENWLHDLHEHIRDALYQLLIYAVAQAVLTICACDAAVQEFSSKKIISVRRHYDYICNVGCLFFWRFWRRLRTSTTLC